MNIPLPTLEICPLVGVGPLRLGVERSRARDALSALGFHLESSRGASDFFCDHAIQVEYSPDGVVWFIGISASERFMAFYLGHDVFDLPAQDLFTLAAAADNSGVHGFSSQEYCFPKQILTLWDADEQYDRKGNEERLVWAQIGVGSSGYAAAVAAIESQSNNSFQRVPDGAAE